MKLKVVVTEAAMSAERLMVMLPPDQVLVSVLDPELSVTVTAGPGPSSCFVPYNPEMMMAGVRPLDCAQAV